MVNGLTPPACFRPRCEECPWWKSCANSTVPAYVTFTLNWRNLDENSSQWKEEDYEKY